MGFFVTKFNETFSSELPGVNEGVIRGAKLIGLKSRNGRRYEAKGLKAATSLYEGRKVFIDHDREGVERRFDDWAGVIENVQYKNDGLYGDIVLRQESAYFKGIVEVANNPKFRKNCGFSHVAEGESNFDGDTEIVESIKEVFSVDLVCDPATTAGIFESVEPNDFNKAVKTLLEECGPVQARLAEMVGAGYIDSDFSLNGGDKDLPSDPVSQLAAIARDLTAALADVTKAVAKANKPEPALPPAIDKSDEDKGDEESEDEDMSPEDKEKIAAFESLSRENAELKAKTMLTESGRQATPALVKAVANCASDDERKELVESLPRIEESHERPTRSAPYVESESDFPRDNPEKFAALLR